VDEKNLESKLSPLMKLRIRMLLKKSDIPQADILEDVIKVTEAVNDGATSYQDIANYIDKVERQGRYYRLAAKNLGFIKNYHNHAVLTDLGRKIISSAPEEKKQLVLTATLDNRLFQRLLPFFEMHPEGVTHVELEQYLKQVSELSEDSTIRRRIDTITSWLRTLGILFQDGDRYFVSYDALGDSFLVEFKDIAEPLLLKTDALREYATVEERTRLAKGTVKYMRNQALTERANNAHTRLVNLVAERVKQSGSLPRCNQLIDLATKNNNKSYIFEMKSANQNNIRSQIRRGLSQLYEYRYLQDLPEAIIVLVVEIPLPNEIGWMNEYLENDRQVSLIWDGNNELYSSSATQTRLSFLWNT